MIETTRVLSRPSEVWNSLEWAKLLTSALIPLTVAIVGYVFSRRIREYEQAHNRQVQAEANERQQKRDEIERRFAPHIEFSLGCNLFGPHHDWYVAELIIYAKNSSLVRHEFKTIEVRVRGTKDSEAPALWERQTGKLEFKHKLLETDIVPKDWNFIFVEPGVTQQICFVTRISKDIRYILVKAEFHYDSYTPHNIERMFECPKSGST